jgi:hypothetical protein
MKVKKLSVAAAGAVIPVFFLGIQAVHAHAGHSHSDSEITHSLPSTSSSADSLLNSGSIFYGEPLPIGNGTFQSFVKFNIYLCSSAFSDELKRDYEGCYS